jgi:hypothetical protein
MLSEMYGPTEDQSIKTIKAANDILRKRPNRRQVEIVIVAFGRNVSWHEVLTF